ncbi:MAG: T9SS type A sorting domain-containing protein [Candidatus Neomarinimicrobiota bacterium]
MNTMNFQKVIFQLLYSHLLVFCVIGNNLLYSQDNVAIELAHVTYEHFDPEMTVGLVTITYNPGDEGKYMSVFTEDYRDDEPRYIYLIANGVYLPSNKEEDSPHSVSVLFDIGWNRQLHYKDPSSVRDYPALFNVTGLLLDIPSDYFYVDQIVFPSQDVLVTETVIDAKGITNDEEPVSTAPITTVTHTLNDGPTRIVYTTNTQNLDLNSSLHPPTATFAGDNSACAPTSSANSLKTMEDEFDNFNLPDGSDLRDVMEELSGHMNRANNSGVGVSQWLRGILNYVETNNLPLEVKFQSSKSDDDVNSSSGNSSATNRNDWGFGIPKPTWDFLMQMKQEKEDVTVTYVWDNPDGTRGGHAVCLSGAREYESGVKKISFKHDRTQGAAGGITNQHETINIDDDGAMRFGPGNKYEIIFVIAKSPIVQEGEEEEGILNEVLGFFGLGKTQYSLLDNNDFIEVALHENIQNIDDYRISLYDGTDGTVYQTITLDQFTVGTTVDNRIYYFYNMTANTLLSGPAGLSISYTGTVLPGQFISYGGSFTAIEGDATSMTSVDIGNFTQGESLALSGTGSKYSDFTWTSLSTPSPGDINPGQNYTLETQKETQIPNHFSLSQNYPNPFNPNTMIRYQLPEESHVSLTIYDINGRQILQLVNESQSAGYKSIQWDSKDRFGQPVSAGLYIYHIQAGQISQTRKMVLLK